MAIPFLVAGAAVLLGAAIVGSRSDSSDNNDDNDNDQAAQAKAAKNRPQKNVKRHKNKHQNSCCVNNLIHAYQKRKRRLKTMLCPISQ